MERIEQLVSNTWLNPVYEMVKRSSRMIKFGLIGGGVFAIAQGIMYLLIDVLGMSTIVAYVIQAVIAVHLNFGLNYAITWSDRKVGDRWRQLIRNWLAFLVTRLGTIAINTVLFALLNAVVHYLIANAATVLIVSIINYLVNDRFVYRRGGTESESLQTTGEVETIPGTAK